MAIPPALCLFQSLGIVFGSLSLFVIVREYNHDQAWNKCASTLSVNQCPYQDAEDSYECRTARRQMDSYIRDSVQKIRRNSPRQLYAVWVVAGIVTVSILTLVLYVFIPPNGLLCLGKIINIAAICAYAVATYWAILFTLHYDKHVTPYKDKICSLWSTLPIHDFGNPILKSCFRDFHICQNAILEFVGLGLGLQASFFHFLAFFAAFWDCQTQIDPSDWGTIENMPEESIIQRPDPPVYEVENEETKRRRALYEKQQEKELRKKVKEIEKRWHHELKLLKVEEKKRRKVQAKRDKARTKLRIEQERLKEREEKEQKDLERKRVKDEQIKLEQELEKKLGAN